MWLNSSLTVQVRLETRLVLTEQQKLELKATLRQLRLDLSGLFIGPEVSVQRGFPLMPMCSHCERSLPLVQPTDESHICSGCGTVFTREEIVHQTRLLARTMGMESADALQLALLSDHDLWDQLRAAWPFKTPLSLFRDNLTLYVNAVERYGTLDAAFTAAGIVYANPALEHWQTHVVSFLGLLPDGVIAEVLGRSRGNIAYYRKQLGVPSHQDLLRSLQGEFSDEAIAYVRVENQGKLTAFREKHKDRVFTDLRAEARKII